MDRLNSNKATINDEFWKESHGRRHDLLVAVRYNDDEAIMAVLKDPKLFRGRAQSVTASSIGVAIALPNWPASFTKPTGIT